jgi:Fic family protein
VHAFVPAPLPPAIDWTPRLLRTLSAADRTLGHLAAEGARLPNPHLLIRPFVRREAVLSSRIEGTEATLGELLAAEAGATVERSPEDLREVASYVAALEHGIARLSHLPLSLRLVRELHAKLLTGARGGRAAAGEFRRTQNWIGPPGSPLRRASFVPPPPNEVAPALHAWEQFLHDRSLPPLVQIALAHYQFEAIHPFLDGNGRVGRLLITLFLVERDLLPAPLLYLSAWFEGSRDAYYRHLRGVSERGAWEPWLLYFLEGVAHQGKDALTRAARVERLLEGWRRQTAEAGLRIGPALVDLLAENPYWTIGAAAKRLGVAYTTAQRAIQRLEALGVVAPTSNAQRDRIFCARALLRVLG